MVKYCKICGKEIELKRLKLFGYCRECATKAKNDGFGKMLSNPKEGSKTIMNMTFGVAPSPKKDLVNKKINIALSNSKSRKRIKKKLLKKVEKGKLTIEEMEQGLKQFDEAFCNGEK